MAGLASLPRWAALVYLCLALPVVVFHTFALPPFQAADEENHFLRAVQLSRGALIGARATDNAAGGFVDASAARVSHLFDYLKFRPEVKLTSESLREGRSAAWTPDDRPFTAFGNTVIYPPFLYGPAVLGLKVAQAFELSVVDSLYLARFVTGLLGLALAATAIALAGPAKPFLFVTLSLPMVLSLFASCTQDAMAIALVALVVALCSRAYAEKRPLGDGVRIGVAAVLGIVIAARPPYLPLLAILCLKPFRSLWGRGTWQHLPACVPLLALALSIILIWAVLGAGPVKVPFRAEDGVSISAQASYLRSDPGSVLTIAANTFSRYSGHYYGQFVGVLGWLDTDLPGAYYTLAGLALLAACLATLASVGAGPGLADRLVLLGSTILALAAVFGAQYLSWTKVGADAVDGVQGRYFIAAALVFPLTIAGLLRSQKLGALPRMRASVGLAWGGLYLFALGGVWVVPWTIVGRYYG